MSNSDELLTTEEIAKRLKVNVVTVRRWLESGKLAGEHLGHRIGYRVRPSDLDEFLARRSAEAKKAAA